MSKNINLWTGNDNRPKKKAKKNKDKKGCSYCGKQLVAPKEEDLSLDIRLCGACFNKGITLKDLENIKKQNLNRRKIKKGLL